MSFFLPDFDDSVVVRAADAELIGGGTPVQNHLLVDSTQVGGALSTMRVTPGEIADMLVIITPGIERFEYFRHLERIRYGKVPPESLLEVQELYDSYFGTSALWEASRTG
ncbi:hypothetical protein [Streptomyces sp. NPDC059957]|uniref:hypothetical protein n=1 Tax=unclassified Streptomyces TaxID=2593676 RepID=UPI00365AE6C7